MQFRQKIFIFTIWIPQCGGETSTIQGSELPYFRLMWTQGRGHFSVSIICEYIASYAKAVIISTFRNINFRLKKFFKIKRISGFLSPAIGFVGVTEIKWKESGRILFMKGSHVRVLRAW